jgi:photosystem II stability/assembly factor-like uncharacterized protein
MMRHCILGVFALFGCMLFAQPSVAQTLFGVFFSDVSTATVVGSGGTILRTTDGGAHWIAQSSGTIQDLTGVFFTDTNTGPVVGYGGTILHTSDGGAHWTP